MPHVEIADGAAFLPDGTCLFQHLDVRVGAGARIALIGGNGLGKSTLLRMLADEQPLSAGTRSQSGMLGVMPQFIGTGEGPQTVREMLAAAAPPDIRRVADELRASEAALGSTPDDVTAQLRYAQAITDWADVGGYLVEAAWDEVTMRAVGLPFEQVAERSLTAFSGGEQKKMVIDSLFSGPFDVLLLDEPDNYLDVPGKRWLAGLIRDSGTTVLFVSHDRELIADAASSILTLEPGADGATIWQHHGGFDAYPEARAARNERLDELQRRWDEQEAQLKRLVLMYQQKAKYNSDMASRLQAARTRLEKFQAAGRPEAAPPPQKVHMRLEGGRTAKRALTIEHVTVPGVFDGVDGELWFGDRVGVIGPNGSGKSHFLAAIADAEERARGEAAGASAWTGDIRIGSRVSVGHFAQTHERSDLVGLTLAEILHRGTADRDGIPRDAALSVLNRYGLAGRADARFEHLSGGQQARFQIALLEVAGKTLLLLDEPTDNLDLVSVEALESALESYQGTVVAVTHDRWFAKRLDRYLYFGADGRVAEVDRPRWE